MVSVKLNISACLQAALLLLSATNLVSSWPKSRRNGPTDSDARTDPFLDGTTESALVDGYSPRDDRNPSQTRRLYRIAVISDLDQDSADDPGVTWVSYLREGNLYLEQDKVNPYRSNVSNCKRKFYKLFKDCIDFKFQFSLKLNLDFNKMGRFINPLNKIWFGIFWSGNGTFNLEPF